MKAVRKYLLGGAAAAAATVAVAAPAAAQYYPYPGGLGDVLVGSILNQILRGGAGGYGGYQYGGYNFANERVAIDQCARATEARLNGYQGGYGNYGYGSYGRPQLRVTQIERVERTRNGNFRVVGWAGDPRFQGNYGAYGGYQQPYGGYNQPYGGYYGGYQQPYGGYAQAAAPTHRFSCKFEARSGRISDLDLDRQRYAGYGYRY